MKVVKIEWLDICSGTPNWTHIEDAVAMVYKDYEKLNRDYTNTCDTLYYNPDPLSVWEDEGDEPEILDYHFCEPKEGDGATDAPERYSIEI